MQRSWLVALVGAVAALSTLIPSPSASAAAMVLGVSFDPNPAKPGHAVIASVTAPPGAAGSYTDCGLDWDGQPMQTQCQDLGGGQLQATFTVPEDAKPGSHDVAGYVVGIPVRGSLEVIEMTKVPPLADLTYTQADDVAGKANLTLCGLPSHEGIVSGQSPTPGTLVSVGSCIEVTLVLLSESPSPNPPPSNGGAPPSVNGGAAPSVDGGTPPTTGGTAPPVPGGTVGTTTTGGGTGGAVGGLVAVLVVGGLILLISRRRSRPNPHPGPPPGPRLAPPGPTGPWPTVPLPRGGVRTDDWTGTPVPTRLAAATVPRTGVLGPPATGRDPLQGRLRLRARFDTTSTTEVLEATRAPRNQLTLRVRPDLISQPDVVEVPR